MNNYELWVHRIAIIVLLIIAVVLIRSNGQAIYMGVKNAEQTLENTRQINLILKIEQTSQEAIIEIFERINGKNN